MVKYIIYGTQTCKYCDMAKKLLEEAEIEYEYRAIDLVPDHFNELRALLPGVKTVPQLFKSEPGVGSSIQYTHLGGYDQLRERLQNWSSWRYNDLDV